VSGLYCKAAWVPPNGALAVEASGWDGAAVVHVIWGRRGNVVSSRKLAARTKEGSRYMLRVEWEGGGFGIDEEAKFIKHKERKP